MKHYELTLRTVQAVGETLANLEGKRAKLLGDAQTALAGKEATDVRFQKYDAAIAEMRALDEEIKRHREADALQNEQRASEKEAEERARAGRPALPQPGAQQNDDQREADKAEAEKRNRRYQQGFNRYLQTRDDSELRAMNSTNGANGGYAIPTLTEPALEQALLAFGGVAPFLDQMPTNSGEQINYPLNNDTANAGREIGENVDSSETDITLATKALTVGLYSTDVVLVPRTLLRDSAFDLAGKVVGILGVRRARLMSSKIINGSTGTSFDSLVSSATSAATSAAPAAVSLAEVAALFGGVDPGYAANGKFVCNRASQIYLSTQRNAQGAPIFPLAQDGLVRQLFGCDLVIDQNMPSIAAGNRALLFGDLKKYILRLVGSMEVQRLEERYATANQVAFLGFWSGGGSLIDAGTHPIQALTQHA